ncbi:YHYH domain-containing protein [Psychrobacillus sp.]|uniref:YHYH domain-containing protein n=1 Tax=Psychrobacillus sp. TaxID=1871623 RepID=UPI0028BD7F52|nr:YHYH domain-containing protein [Psychrobacillus sp.]
MKKVVGILLSFVLLLVITTPAMAHPGRTDANGGHTCRTNCGKWGLNYGEYHYHNGGTTKKTSTSKTVNTKPETIYVDPYTQAEALIKTAESYAGSLKWETSYDYRVSKYSSNPVSQIDMKLYNNTKSAINAAKANSNVLLYSDLEERLNALNDIYIRTQAYIDAINSGEKLLVQFQNYQSFYKQDPNSDKTKKAYNELIKLSKKTNTMIYRVYGKSTREAMLDKFRVE